MLGIQWFRPGDSDFCVFFKLPCSLHAVIRFDLMMHLYLQIGDGTYTNRAAPVTVFPERSGVVTLASGWVRLFV